MESSHQLDTATTPTGASRMPDSLCTHTPKCPTAASSDREAAQVVAAHPEQGWSVNCTFLKSLGTAMSDCPRSSV
ncbi:DUF5999 family protein (plasmid) [Streptomyces sp. NBC_01213]|uniref:DUF5999 family protein n=1 Tax=Streptomyces sp. NBC_01213 TaxID=2903776 RepID=UPI00352DAF0B|nr:DUF5999 family protein [Streptomyces sp. NBC_01213]